MSITWEEPGAGGALKKTATQIAALVLLAVAGGAGGAAIASWSLHGGPVEDGAPAETAAAATADVPDTPDAVAKPDAGPLAGDAAGEPASGPDMFGPPQLAALSLPRAAAGRETPPAADPVRRADEAERADIPVEELPVDEMPAGEMPAGTVAAEPASAGIDAGETASITDAAAPVDVAESEEEVAALEAKMAAEGAAGFAAPDAQADRTAAVVPADKPETPRGPRGEALAPAKAAKYVNLRAGPDNDAEVLAIVPAKADLLAEENCRHWCAVVHEGRAGYIYRTFIAGRG